MLLTGKSEEPSESFGDCDLGRTQYLYALAEPDRASVWVGLDDPIHTIGAVASRPGTLRYSPIFPAYLIPDRRVPSPPDPVAEVAFLFCSDPYTTLGQIRPSLTEDERASTYFSQGLASILCFGIKLERAVELANATHAVELEFWHCDGGSLDLAKVVSRDIARPLHLVPELKLERTGNDELDVYVEQIAAAADTLWRFYSRYQPTELETLRRVAQLTGDLTERYSKLLAITAPSESALAAEKGRNAIQSALVELGAALSYAITQGTTGRTPIFENPSPFPHRSLLGVGGAVRALTHFTRYLEGAFSVRSAAEVISKQYSNTQASIPSRISRYVSGSRYSFEGSAQSSPKATVDPFDRGGAFEDSEHVPLIAHFSLRHGFKESKFSVTAASESLSAESQPQWTLMTLSHEVMHSRVRDIFRALFGLEWDDKEASVLTEDDFESFRAWYEADGEVPGMSTKASIRNAVLLFCHAMVRADQPVTTRRTGTDLEIRNLVDFTDGYYRFRMRAVELFVHFHDFYFVYACQARAYALSLWASWIRVAPPLARPKEYLVRSLATLACGTGSTPQEAFGAAVEVLEDTLDELERVGIESPLFWELRRLLAEERGHVFALFKPAHYLIDHVALFFKSREVASRIDGIESDPFAEGSELVGQYSANVFVFPDEDDDEVSPTRFTLASLLHSLSNGVTEVDGQWRSAWNLMVVSSGRGSNGD